MLIGFVAVAVGVVLLAWASDQFVIGAMRVALLKKVPSLVVGVVIVGFGTSAPEMLVSASAAASGDAAVALGNVVGSNIANLSLLLGVGAMIVPIAVTSRTVRREGMLTLAAVVAFAAVAQGGGITRLEGLVLVAAMVGALWIVMRPGADIAEDPLASDVDDLAHAAASGMGRELARLGVGLVGTIGGAQLLLWGALRVADEAGLSEGFVGITLVAIGTSLPELVTVVQSARRGETDLIVGNLLGSNLFNALAVTGLVGLIGGTPVDDPAITTVGAIAAIVACVAASQAMRTARRVSRPEGVALVVGYVVLLPFLN